jgi:signal transduction histidine kinase
MNIQPQSAIYQDGRGLRPNLDELRQNTQLLIRLRWAAGFAILLGTAFAGIVLEIHLETGPLVSIGLAVLVYNVVLYQACRGEDKPLERLQRVAWGQIVLDWTAMIALVHFTGGITSPALIYFVIHTALAGTVLLPWQTRSLTVLVIVMVSGLTWLEGNGWLTHIVIPELEPGDALHTNANYITAMLFFFGTAAITMSELVARNAQRLRQREERIRQLYEARSTFLRVATHELRAPLAAGLSLMRNIEQGYAGEFNEKQADLLSRVTRRLAGLRTLVDDLLTLAASQEVSAANVPLEPVSVRPTLDALIERERPNVEQKHITLHCDMDDEEGIVMAGEVGLAIILGNLLNNAIKYTPDDGDVTIVYHLDRPTQSLEITFKDTGIGIPAEDLPNIFNEFFRARNAKKAQVTGTGIGLSTVRTLLDRYHGDIDLQSEEGKGTTVKVTLPLAPRQVKIH